MSRPRVDVFYAEDDTLPSFSCSAIPSRSPTYPLDPSRPVSCHTESLLRHFSFPSLQYICLHVNIRQKQPVATDDELLEKS